jgi:hypothetical protein
MLSTTTPSGIIEREHLVGPTHARVEEHASMGLIPANPHSVSVHQTGKVRRCEMLQWTELKSFFVYSSKYLI